MEPSGHAFGVPKDELREIGDSFIRGADSRITSLHPGYRGLLSRGAGSRHEVQGQARFSIRSEPFV